MREDIIILSRNDWAFADQTTGEKKEGSTLHYILKTKSENGHEPQKLSVRPDSIILTKVNTVPCSCIGVFAINTSKNGIKLILNDVEEVQEMMF